MNPVILFPPELASFLGTRTKEEIHQIGLSLLQQSGTVEQQNVQPRPSSGLHHPLSPSSFPPPTSSASRQMPSYTPSLMMNHHHQHQQQQHSPSRTGLDHQQLGPISTSTPRRPASESFDNSSGSKQQATKRLKQNDIVQPISQQQIPVTNGPLGHNKFNLGVLRWAVASNLPCFFVEFDSTIEPSNIPSCTQLAIAIKKLLMENKMPINELSMCIPAGIRRFKFGVNDKDDFIKMFNWSWPNEIDGKPVEVSRPRSLPDCFSLVVRYIPVNINEENARIEVFKAIPAAVAFSAIRYNHRQRPSYDLKFSVADLEQYRMAIELGRISIGQHYLPLTHFLPGNRITYCTACWKLGHLRDKCNSPVCCRKCLSVYQPGVKHVCKEAKFKCAQCAGDHFSLDPVCPVVKQYRWELKQAVDSALEAGTIKRVAVGEIRRPFQRMESEFPALGDARAEVHAAWRAPTAASEQPELTKELNELMAATKKLSDTMARIELKLDDSAKRLEQHDKRMEMHSNSMVAVIDSLQIMSKWMLANNSEKTKLKKKVTKTAEDLLKWKRLLEVNKNDTNLSTVSPSHPISTNNININVDDEDDKDDEQSMASVDNNA